VARDAFPTPDVLAAVSRRRAARREAELRRAHARRRRRTRIPTALAMLLGLASAALPAATATGDRPGPVAPSPSLSVAAPLHVSGPGAVRVMNLHEPGSGTVHAVWVYRPAVPDSARLPVLYFLHGLPGQADEVFRTGLAASLDRYFRAGAAPFVVASPNGHDARADPEWGDSADGSQHLESFVVNTVISAVEGGHRRDRAHRAIAGFSMGGYGAANLALHHPDLFGQLITVAGYFHVDDPDHVFGAGPALAAWNSPDRQVQRARGLRILLLDANHDKVPDVRGQSQRFASLLRAAGTSPTVHIAPGGHDWTYVASQFTVLQSFLEAGWS
jgi:S-formylglutathione hydrolase FrmB